MMKKIFLSLLLITLVETAWPQHARSPLEDPPWIKSFAGKPLVYTVQAVDKVEVRRDLVYKRVGSQDLKMDVYRLATNTRSLPAIIFIHGGFLPVNLRTEPKDWEIFQGYGSVVAASGFIGIAFNHRLYESWMSLENSTSDLADLIAYVRKNADTLGVDADRIALWSFSAGGPLLASALRQPEPYIRCIVSYYSLLDLQHTERESRGTLSDQALLDYSPLHQLELQSMPVAPMFVARMGHDMPNINDSVDRFIPVALLKNVDLTLINDPEGHHGFDIEDNTDASREIIRETVEFLKIHLAAKR